MHFFLVCVAVFAFCSTLVSSQPTGLRDLIPSGFFTPFASQTTCKLQVYQGTKSLGYLSTMRNSRGEYGTLQPSSSGALSVAFSASKSNSKQLSLRVVGENAQMSMFGGIVGFSNLNDNLVAGSYNYAYIGLTPQTPSGSVPLKGTNSFDQVQNFERNIQSAIWSFDSATKQLTPQWVNTNKATPKNYLLHVTNEKALVFTADKAEFQKVLNVTFSEVSLSCVS